MAVVCFFLKVDQDFKAIQRTANIFKKAYYCCMILIKGLSFAVLFYWKSLSGENVWHCRHQRRESWAVTARLTLR